MQCSLCLPDSGRRSDRAAERVGARECLLRELPIEIAVVRSWHDAFSCESHSTCLAIDQLVRVRIRIRIRNPGKRDAEEARCEIRRPRSSRLCGYCASVTRHSGGRSQRSAPTPPLARVSCG